MNMEKITLPEMAALHDVLHRRMDFLASQDADGKNEVGHEEYHLLDCLHEKLFGQ